MQKFWDEEAAEALGKVFGVQFDEETVVDLDELQSRLNSLIDSSFGKTGIPSETVNEGWLAIGSYALQYSNSIYPDPLSFDECFDTLVKKHADYGPFNILRFSEPGAPGGLLVRTWDKVARIVNLTERGIDPENESLRDSFLDLVNYSAIGLMIEKDAFHLPLKGH